jgi:hypothetical protein
LQQAILSRDIRLVSRCLCLFELEITNKWQPGLYKGNDILFRLVILMEQSRGIKG